MSSSTHTFQPLMAFERHSRNISRLSKARDYVPTKRLMSAYLQWAAECDVRAFGDPSVDLFLLGFVSNRDLEGLFESRFGNLKLKKAFIRHIYKEAERSAPERLYLGISMKKLMS
ncbi:hypothetical protein DFH28DRAFT_1064942 [Melampsora americana]|nr:hypothetical protein DFH28DRAFT_1064942 [Melampsora americana]